MGFIITCLSFRQINTSMYQIIYIGPRFSCESSSTSEAKVCLLYISGPASQVNLAVSQGKTRSVIIIILVGTDMFARDNDGEFISL